MRQINIPIMQDMIRHNVLRLNEPCMIWGPSGCGKTEGVEQVSAEQSAYLCDIRVSGYEGVDFRGMPAVTAPSGVMDPVTRTVTRVPGKTVWNLPATIPFVGNDAFPDDRPIVLFLDEINSAQDDGVYAVCYQLVQQFRVGEHVLKPNVRIVAAGNRETDRGVTRRMPHPLANRFTHAEVIVDPAATIQHMHRQGVPRLLLGFLQWRKHLISTFDPASAEKSVASPRTWMKAAKYYADPHMPDALKWVSISGAVGEGPATEFQGFVALAGNVVTTKQIIADPDGAPLPQNDSAGWATATNISGDMTLKNAGPLGRYLQRMGESREFGPEYEIAAWQMAIKRDEMLYDADAYLRAARVYKAAFGA